MTDVRSVSQPTLFSFVGGESGDWSIVAQTCQAGDPLPRAAFLDVRPGPAQPSHPAGWTLRGVVSNERYVERPERDRLVATQAPLGRAECTRAALIPIRKSAAWWACTQDERRAIFEERSRHIALSLSYLPRVARRLHHSRDLGEPFDFLTWFDFAEKDAAAFDELVGRLRETEEWTYVDREIDIRVAR
ncbi:MAG: chlorite dismutase family protein [Mycobacteriales bacterium]